MNFNDIHLKNTNLNLKDFRNENLKNRKNSDKDRNNANIKTLNNDKNNLRIVKNENEKNFRRELNRGDGKTDTSNKVGNKNESLNGSRFITQQNDSNINTQN